MGAFTSIAQGIGGAGNDLGKAATEMGQERRQQAAQQLQQLFAKLQLMELQNRIQQQGITNQQKDPSAIVQAIEKALGHPMTEEQKERVFGIQPPAPKANPLAQKITDAEQLLGPLTTPDKRSLVGLSKPDKTPTPYADWRQQNPNAPVAEWLKTQEKYRGKPAAAGGGSSNEGMLKALADKWQNEGIKPPAKYQAAVEQYMEEHGQRTKDKPDASALAIQRDAIKASATARDAYTNLQDAERLKTAKNPRAHLGLVFQAVRAMVAGAGRMTNTEIQNEIKAGSMPERVQRWYSQASTGLIPDDQIEEIMSVIRSNYEAKRQAGSEAWKYAYPDKPLPQWMQGATKETAAPAAAAAPAGAASSGGAPAVGTVKTYQGSSYRFKGGDWKDKSNWEKQ